jgi:hypothetical protein
MMLFLKYFSCLLRSNGSYEEFNKGNNQTRDKEIEKLIGTYLGNVFNALPQGIINKTETGIGANALELNAPRN